MEILAADLGIRKSAACEYDVEGPGGSFVTVGTMVESMEALFKKARLARVVREVGPITA